MKTRYYKYTLQGERSPEDAQRAVAGAAPESNIVRIDNVRGQTHVYVATQDTGAVQSASTIGRPATASSDLKAEEVSESDVTKIG